MAERFVINRVAPGVYRVEHDGRGEIVYVTGSQHARWAFWRGHIFHDAGTREVRGRQPASTEHRASQSLAAPMPATVIKVLVAPGIAVKKGDTVVILEAMKMELPVRAPADAVVTAVHCREGDLVQADMTLIELEQAI